MKRLNAVEKWALTLAGLFVVVGILTTVRPADLFMTYPGSSQNYVIYVPPAEATALPKKQVRAYGFITMVVGLGLGVAALWPRRG